MNQGRKRSRIDKEKAIVEQMIILYCSAKHRQQGLCRECRELQEYAHARLDRCKFGNSKSSCRRCPVHCYKPEMREKIRQVMRFSGPRLLLYRPLEFIRHMFR